MENFGDELANIFGEYPSDDNNNNEDTEFQKFYFDNDDSEDNSELLNDEFDEDENLSNYHNSQYNSQFQHPQQFINDQDLTNLENEEDTNTANPFDYSALDQEFEKFQITLKQVTGIGSSSGGNTGGGLYSKGRPRKNQLDQFSDDIQRDVREAHQLYVNGKLDEALQLTHQVIAKNPSVSDAWNTLGIIWEDYGDKHKSFQAFLLAAHINPYDSARWTSLADKSQEEGLYNQALYCISKAVMVDSFNLELIKRKIELCKLIGEDHRTMISYRQLLRISPWNLKVLRELIILCTEMKTIQKCVEPMHQAMTLYLSKPTEASSKPYKLTMDLINVMVELYMEENRYLQCARRVIRGYDIIVLGANNDDWVEDHMTLSLIADQSLKLLNAPDSEFPLELKARFGTVLSLLNLKDVGHQFHEYFYTRGGRDQIDIYIDIANDFKIRGEFDLELKQYKTLLINFPDEYHEIWTKMANCYLNMGELREAIECFERVESLGHANKETLTSMKDIYNQLGENDKAVRMLNKLVILNSTTSQNQDLSYLYEDDNNEDYEQFDEDEDAGSDYEPPTQQFDQNLDDDDATYVFKKTKIKKAPVKKKQRKVKKRNIYASFSVVQNIENNFEKLNLLNIEGASFLLEFSETIVDLSKQFIYKQKWFFEKEPNSILRKDYEIPEILLNATKYSAVPPEFYNQMQNYTFHGYSLHHWYQLFILAAINLYKLEDGQKANQLFKDISHCYLTDKFPNFQLYLKLLNLSLAYNQGDFNSMAEFLRFWIQKNTNDPRLYGLYSTALSSGFRSLSYFGNPSIFKYFTRLLIENEKKVDKGLLSDNLPNELYYIQGLMLLSGRSYLTGIHFFHQSLKMFPGEAIIKLCLGLCYLMLSTARTTDNRHYQVLQVS